MMCLQHHDSHGQMMTKKRLATGKWKWLLKHDDTLELSRITRGIDIHPVKIQDLTLWMWDFGGQTVFHSSQDFIFPNGSSVHAASAFVFIFNPILDHNSSNKRGGRQGIKSEHQFKQEFSYWLRFICSNAKPRPSRASKPLVLVVITHIDSLKTQRTRQDVEMATREWVRDMASMFGHLVTLEARNLFFVDATDQDDSEVTSFVAHTIHSLRTRIGNVAKVPTICDAVAKALGQGGSDSGQQQQLEPIISIQDFQSLCKSTAEELSLQQLVSNTSAADKLPKAVAAYLRDAGEVLYSPDLPFIVRNPRWFAHGILGYLVNIFSDHDDDDAPPTSCCVTKRQAQRMRKQDAFRNGLVSKDSLSELLQTALNKLGLNPNGVNTDQLIKLMEELDLCYPTEHDNKYLVPAVFEDEGDKAANGERQRSWKVVSSSTRNTIFVTRRLECSDPIRTFVTPGFFPRLQVVLHNKTGEWAKDKNPDNCTLDKNLCHLHFNGMEILVEYSGSSGYSVDVMVQSCQPRKETVEFVESQIIRSIRRLCASRKGCPGVTLAEAIIRPDCVGAGKITLCRYRQSILVDDLKQLMASIPNYMHSWNAVTGEDGTVILHSANHHPKLLLDGEGQGEAGSVAGIQEVGFVSDMPKLILVTWQDVNWARDMAAKAAKMLKAWRAEPFRLHLQCECREGPHDVREQPGRTFYVADQRFVMVQGAGAQAAGVVATGLQVGGLFVPGLTVAGGVASGLGQSYKPTPVFPFDIETLSQRITSARPRNVEVPPEALREEVEKDLQSSTEGRWLRAFLNPDAQAFTTDFRLTKVQYMTSPLAGSTAWLCDQHWTEGRDQRSLRGV